MRWRYVPDEKLNDIIRLKNSRASWVKIQKETGVPRRTAQRAYEEYEKSKSVQELKAARQQVISEQFNYHLQDLIAFAHSLTFGLGDPTIGDKRSADEIIDEIFKRNIRVHRINNSLTGNTSTQKDVVIRQNKMLFESLKAHTREVVRWKPLEEWRTARDSWIHNLNNLKKEATKIVDNLLQEKVDQIEIPEITAGVFEAACRAIINDQLEEAENLIKLIPQENGVQLTFSGDSSGKLLRYEDTELADNICNLARQSVTNLRAVKESRIVDNMVTAVKTMKIKKSELVYMLDELRLIPLILGTRCDICPAL